MTALIITIILLFLSHQAARSIATLLWMDGMLAHHKVTLPITTYILLSYPNDLVVPIVYNLERNMFR